IRERMGASRGHTQADALGRIGEAAPAANDFLAELVDAGADLGADLDNRLVELALGVVAERRGARREELGDVGSKLPGRRIDDLELFLDANGERVSHWAYPAGNHSLRDDKLVNSRVCSWVNW